MSNTERCLFLLWIGLGATLLLGSCDSSSNAKDATVEGEESDSAPEKWKTCPPDFCSGTILIDVVGEDGHRFTSADGVRCYVYYGSFRDREPQPSDQALGCTTTAHEEPIPEGTPGTWKGMPGVFGCLGGATGTITAKMLFPDGRDFRFEFVVPDSDCQTTNGVYVVVIVPTDPTKEIEVKDPVSVNPCEVVIPEQG